MSEREATMSNVNEMMQLQSVREWEHERQARINGYAAALTHLNSALENLPAGDASYNRFAEEVDHVAHAARGRMSAIFQETNPFVKATQR
jgi:hypothetical protein